MIFFHLASLGYFTMWVQNIGSGYKKRLMILLIVKRFFCSLWSDGQNFELVTGRTVLVL